MKKFILAFSIFAISALTGIVYSATNMPGPPVYNIPKNTTSLNTTNNNQYSANSQLDSFALGVLHAAENHNDAEMQSYLKKLMAKGVTEICQPQIMAKQTPQCPPIKLQVNGRNLSGSLCAFTCYKYNGKTYEVGYCK